MVKEKLKKAPTLTLTTGLIIAVIMVLTSCGGNSGDGKVKPETTTISGPLEDYLEIVDGEYQLSEYLNDNNFYYNVLSFKVKVLKPFTLKMPPEEEMEEGWSTFSWNQKKNNPFTVTIKNKAGTPISEMGNLIWLRKGVGELYSALESGKGEVYLTMESFGYEVEISTGAKNEFPESYKHFTKDIAKFSVHSSLPKGGI